MKEFEWFEWFEWFGPSPIEPFNSVPNPRATEAERVSPDGSGHETEVVTLRQPYGGAVRGPRGVHARVESRRAHGGVRIVSCQPKIFLTLILTRLERKS